MIHPLVTAIRKQMVMALALVLVALAIYVSLGQQLAPLAANYSEEVAQRLERMTGMEVRIGELQGHWQDFSPRFDLADLAISVDRAGDEGEAPPAILIEDVSLELDLLASLRQWRLVTRTVVLRDVALEFAEQPDGSWRFAGGAGLPRGLILDPRQLFRLATRLSDLRLSDSHVRLEHTDGRMTRLHDVGLQFRSDGGRHVMQLDARLDEAGDVSMAAELRGAGLGELGGNVHLSLPEADYGPLLDKLRWNGLGIERVAGTADIWLELDNGDFHEATTELNVAELQLRSDEAGSAVALRELSGQLHLQHGNAADWRLWAEALQFSRGGQQWPAADLYLESGPASVTMQASRLRFQPLSRIMVDLALLPGGVQEEMEALNPRGALQDMRVEAAIGEDGLQQLSLRSNLDDLRVSARGPAPALWGVTGYAELEYSSADQRATGLIEVDSPDLTIRFPRLFDDLWAYDRVNGRVRFRVDTGSVTRVRVSSSTIEAVSPAIDGRVKFATEWLDDGSGEPTVNLELMVGALEADGRHTSMYLPMADDAPGGIQEVLQWVDEAVVAGDAAGSGVIFRGNIHPGADPASNTLQMFYHVSDGHLRFDSQWPALEQLEGLVVMDDGQVDVAVEGGSSLGIDFQSTRAMVRPNQEGPGSWITVSGQGVGEAGQGLEYLRRSPVTEGLDDYLAGWETDGEVDFRLGLAIPVSVEGADPLVNLQLGVSGNRLHIPQYDLEIEQFQGRMFFNTRQGFSSEDLTGEMFGQPVEFSLNSTNPSDGVFDARVEAAGTAGVEALLRWSKMPAWLDPVLSGASGLFDYQATLTLPRGETEPSLAVSSQLKTISLNYPEPLHKPEGQSLPLDVQIGFDGRRRALQISVGEVAAISAELEGQTMENGLIFLGPTDGARVRRFNADEEGLLVLGRIPRIELQPWRRFIDDNPEILERGMAIGGGLAATVDVTLGELAVYGQRFEEVNLQWGSARRQHGLQLISDSLAGTIRPPSSDAPLTLSLQHLYVGEADDTTGADAQPAGQQVDEETIPFDELPTVEYVMPREDPLADLDPRQFPPLRFSVDALKVAGEDYGSWSFNLEPRPDGALFRDLQVDAHGLRIGGEEEPARFHWRYENGEHDSELEATITADNLAEVLQAYGYAPSLESSSARFDADVGWDGSPAFFAAVGLSGSVDMTIRDGRFLGGSGAGSGALKLISFINLDAIVRRVRFSDDLLRSGLAYDAITGRVELDEGIVHIIDRLQIIGPSSLFQISGQVNLVEETIDGRMYITLPVSENIPWLGGLAALNNLINWQVAVGVFVLERIFGDQVDELTSAQYRLEGSWDDLEPELEQVFSAGE